MKEFSGVYQEFALLKDFIQLIDRVSDPCTIAARSARAASMIHLGAHTIATRVN